MATSGRVRLRKILRMLDKCAPGYSIEEKEHYRWVRYGEQVYHLPKGAHGKKNPEIEKGHVKQMVRHLKINLECAKEHLGILK